MKLPAILLILALSGCAAKQHGQGPPPYDPRGQYKVCWTGYTGGERTCGYPISKVDAEAWAKESEKHYPGLKATVERVR